jgi:murein DD-endopeptidase MepM/ murein hydrolase activator NlpD
MRSLSLNFASTWLTAMLALTGCSQPANYAPVKTTNQALTPQNGYMPSPPPHPSVYSLPEDRLNTAKSAAKPENLNRLPDSTAREAPYQQPGYDTSLSASNRTTLPNKKIDRPASPEPATMPKTHESSARQQNAGIGANSKDAGKAQPTRPMQPYLAETAASKTRNNPHTSQKKNPPLALLRLENSENSSLTARRLEKNSYKEKSILSIDNKKMLKLKFEWPLTGKITRNFVQTDNKGIDIKGKLGQTVHASEAGKAVYCGQGLAGFGNLAVIKHNETYLSAYANASRLFIREGQRISKGQAIGEIGDSGFKRALLHFEIRKHGKSINPLTVLPKL